MFYGVKAEVLAAVTCYHESEKLIGNTFVDLILPFILFF